MGEAGAHAEGEAPGGTTSFAGGGACARCGLLAVVLAVALLALVPMGLNVLFGLRVRGEPCGWHVGDYGPLLAAADALMADPARHGQYGAPTAQDVERARQQVGPPPAPWRPLADLPEVVRAAAPARVSVGPDQVTLAWERRGGYAYGYSLLLLSEGARAAREAELRRSHGSFQSNTEVAPRAWSHWPFH